MKSEILFGFVAGAMAIIGSQAGLKMYGDHKRAKPNAWEKAFETAEFIPYKQEWNKGSVTTSSTAMLFGNVHRELDTPAMRIFKTYAPDGTKALLVSTMYSGLVAIYEDDNQSRRYRAVGNPAVMDKRLEGQSLFIDIIPDEFLIDVCDPTSAIYQRDDLDPYYDFSAEELTLAAKNDELLETFICELVEAVCAEDYQPENGLVIIPELVEKHFPHLNVVINEEDSNFDVELEVGNRQRDRREAYRLEELIKQEQAGKDNDAAPVEVTE